MCGTHPLVPDVRDDGTVLVLSYSDSGDSWHGAVVTRRALLRALGVATWQTGQQIEDWAGRPVSDAEHDRLDEAIPFSSIPDAMCEIVASFSEEL